MPRIPTDPTALGRAVMALIDLHGPDYTSLELMGQELRRMADEANGRVVYLGPREWLTSVPNYCTRVVVLAGSEELLNVEG